MNISTTRLGIKLIAVLFLISTSYGFIACSGSSNDGKIKYKGVSNPTLPDPSGRLSSLQTYDLGDHARLGPEREFVLETAGESRAVSGFGAIDEEVLALVENEIEGRLEVLTSTSLIAVDLMSDSVSTEDLDVEILGLGVDLAIDPDGKRRFLLSRLHDDRSVVSQADFGDAGFRPLWVSGNGVAGAGRDRLLLDADRSRLLLVRMGEGTVHEIDLDSGRTRLIEIGVEPVGGLVSAALTAEGRLLLIAASGAALVIDARDDAIRPALWQGPDPTLLLFFEPVLVP